MGEQGDYDYTIWAEQVFTKNNSVRIQIMLNNKYLHEFKTT